MSGKAGKVVELMDQQMALHSYLEEMLREVPDYVEEETPEPTRPVAVVESLPAQEVKPEPVPVVEEIIPKPVARVKEVIPEPVAEIPPVEERKPESTGNETRIPGWASKRFQCLLFNVAGITLAVPLEKLNGVIPWSDSITPMPGHSPAFLGLLRHLEKNVKVMDTAQIILPEKQKNAIESEPGERIHKIILMDEGRWGLACDEVGDVIDLEQGDVRWRTAQGKRPWLAGTISERLCALLDTDVFASMLEQGFGKDDHV